MQPIQTLNNGVILAGGIDDLQDLLIGNCGHDIWDFIKWDDQSEISKLECQVEELESEVESRDKDLKDLESELSDSEKRVEELEKELKALKPQETQTVEDDEDSIPF